MESLDARQRTSGDVKIRGKLRERRAKDNTGKNSLGKLNRRLSVSQSGSQANPPCFAQDDSRGAAKTANPQMRMGMTM